MARRVERIKKHDWVEVDFMDLTSGCTFRMFEEDGTQVIDEKGHTQWIAAGKPHLKDGKTTIKVYQT